MSNTKRMAERVAEIYGIHLTEQQVSDILTKNPELDQEVREMGVDTDTRHWFINTLSHSLGMQDWPLGGDSDEYAMAFFLTFEAKAKEAGIKLNPDFVDRKFLY